MKDPNLPGVYCIRNKENGLAYVGSSTKAIRLRWWQHRNDWGKGKGNRHIRADWNQYGEDAFEFKVLENVLDLTAVIDREQYWIDKLGSCFGDNGYNICPKAGSNLGSRHKMSENGRANVAKANKGKCKGFVHSEQSRRNMSEAHKGKPVDQSWRQTRAVRWTESQRESMKRARQDGRLKNPPNLKGRKRSEAFIENLRAKRLGDANPNKGYEFSIIAPDGSRINDRNLHRFCKERGLDSSAMSKVINGKAKTYRGYRAAP